MVCDMGNNPLLTPKWRFEMTKEEIALQITIAMINNQCLNGDKTGDKAVKVYKNILNQLAEAHHQP